MRAWVAMCLALGATTVQADELDDEAEAIRARVPVGTPLEKVPEAMRGLGFTCTLGAYKYKDLVGQPREAPHYDCEREEPFLLVCTRRTRAIALQERGRVANVIVNVGRSCGPLGR
jgi:hypothetical protein